MKQIIIAAILMIFFVGCSQDMNINSPIDNPFSNDVQNSRLLKDAEPNWIVKNEAPMNMNTFDQKSITIVDKDLTTNNDTSAVSYGNQRQYTVSGFIYKDRDSEFIIDKSHSGGIYGEIKNIVKLKFNKGSVSENSFITISSNPSTCLLTFGPGQTFLKPGNLYVKHEGLDLRGLNATEIDFVYMNANGAYEHIQYGEIIVDMATGTLELKDGKIPHFSRYGFIRKGNN